MKRDIKRYLIVIFCFMMIGVGCALTLKSGIGVGAWDALSQTGYDLTGIKAGTFSMILNCSCVVVEIVVLGKNFRPVQILQVPCSIVFGYVTNFVLYDILGNIVISNYFINLALFIFGTCWNAVFVSAIMAIDAVTTALEGACAAVATKVPMNYARIRQLVDVVAIIIILLLVFFADAPLSIREGTVIAMLIFGPMLGQFTRRFQKIAVKLDLHNPDNY